MLERSIESGYRFGQPTYRFDNKAKRKTRTATVREVRPFKVLPTSRLKNGMLYTSYNGRAMIEVLRKKNLSITSVSCSKGVTVWYSDNTIQAGHTLTPGLVSDVIGFSSEKGGTVYFYVETAQAQEKKGEQIVEPEDKTGRDARRAAKEAHRKNRLEKREMKRANRLCSSQAAK